MLQMNERDERILMFFVLFGAFVFFGVILLVTIMPECAVFYTKEPFCIENFCVEIRR
jgi:hypothetical protein